jgi:Leucine rich repeat
LCGVDIPDEAIVATITDFSPPFQDTEEDHMVEFVNLKQLDVSGNKFSLDSLLCFPALEELAAACNQMSTLPDLHPNIDGEVVLPSMYSLRSLDLSYNFLTWLPASMSQFVQLQKLDLRRNHIASSNATHIWQVLGELPKLLHLDLSENIIDCVPERLTNLFPRLVHLDLAKNRIRNAAALQGLFDVPTLQRLDLRGNPCTKFTITESRSAQSLSVLFDEFVRKRQVIIALRTPDSEPGATKHANSSKVRSDSKNADSKMNPTSGTSKKTTHLLYNDPSVIEYWLNEIHVPTQFTRSLHQKNPPHQSASFLSLVRAAHPSLGSEPGPDSVKQADDPINQSERGYEAVANDHVPASLLSALQPRTIMKKARPPARDRKRRAVAAQLRAMLH